jgi:hypothetical protein
MESPELALRLYSLAVEMADRLSARRAAANNFFLAVQSALAALLAAFAVRSAPTSQPTDKVLLTLALLAGLVLAVAWWLLLTSYRRLSTAKFAVINKIEADHFKVRPFSDEWVELKKSRPTTRNPLSHVASIRDRYAELGVVEQVVPLAFGVLYALIALRLWTQ